MDEPLTRPMHRWDIFCRVVDNFGDAALCWRLAHQLATEYPTAPRLWIDHPATLTALHPRARAGCTLDGVQIELWSETDVRLTHPDPNLLPDVVVAALGCTLPQGYRQAMRHKHPTPLWVNVEHVSAEPWIEGCHGLSSPKADGLIEYFFFPGFTPRTGGLLREARLLAERDRWMANPAQAQAWLNALGVYSRPHERLISVFCYTDAPITALLARWPDTTYPWRLLVAEGVLPNLPDHPGVSRIPFLSQTEYDHLLWCCALNFVRGEDSLIRGLWAGRPIIWQAYRQPESAHQAKVTAFLDHWQTTAQPSPTAVQALRSLTLAWNGMTSADDLANALDATLAEWPALLAASTRWVQYQTQHADLAHRLYDWVMARL